jgi:hypothetical protein
MNAEPVVNNLSDLEKYQRIRESQRKANKKYRESHPEKFRQYSKKYYEANCEKQKEAMRQQYLKSKALKLGNPQNS